MAWVMMPVPQELVQGVEILVLQLRYQSEALQWGNGLMGEHLQSLGDEPRALVSIVATRVLEGEPIEDVALAKQLQVSVSEVFGLVSEANHILVEATTGDLIHALHQQIDDGAGGSRRRRVLHMHVGLAQMVRDWEATRELRPPPSPEH